MSKDENLQQYRKALADTVRAANWLSIPEKMAELSSLLEAMAAERERNHREGFGIETAKCPFMGKDVMTTAQVAAYLKVHPTSVINWRKTSGLGPDYFKIGDSVRYRREDVWIWEDSLQPSGYSRQPPVARSPSPMNSLDWDAAWLEDMRLEDGEHEDGTRPGFSGSEWKR